MTVWDKDPWDSIISVTDKIQISFSWCRSNWNTSYRVIRVQVTHHYVDRKVFKIKIFAGKALEVMKNKVSRIVHMEQKVYVVIPISEREALRNQRVLV